VKAEERRKWVEEAAAAVTAKKAEERRKWVEEAAAAKQAAEDAAAKSVMEIDGLAAAVARVKLGGDVLTGAAAWIAAAGAQSVAQLEPDDIDGALSFASARYSAERSSFWRAQSSFRASRCRGFRPGTSSARSRTPRAYAAVNGRIVYSQCPYIVAWPGPGCAVCFGAHWRASTTLYGCAAAVPGGSSVY
jgi:hypothetical protein